ncbi:MAG: DUF4388 domain-containing protein [Chloroflexi bacterium]|nr:DUF4388 domain-containing protein [Chloroflexota bacterium]
MALSGSLSDVFFGDLIQLYCQPRSRARLTARHGKDQVVIYFNDGELVHAESRQSEGVEAVYELACWDNGDFLVEQGIPSPKVTIDAPWSSILMEAVRLRDESAIDSPSPFTSAPSILQSLHEMLIESSFEGLVAINRNGVVLAAELPGSLEASRVGAIATSILNLSDRSVGQLARGKFQQTLIQGATGDLIITFAGSNAILVALADHSINLGMAFLEARHCAQKLAELIDEL